MKVAEVAKLSPLERLLYWIRERESIRLKKEAGEPNPWTDDEILQRYRFCNVHREDDKVTRWIAKHWRNPNTNAPDVWFLMLVARVFNNPKTLAELPIRWDAHRYASVLHARADRGDRVFNPAYIVSTNGVAMNKVDYVVMRVLVPARMSKIHPATTLSGFASQLMSLNGVSTFMAGQVIADIKYTALLNKASDWWTWAASGPGSRRGLNRLLNRDPASRWKEPGWLESLTKVRVQVLQRLNNIKIHAQDLQNCLCEFDKYERVRLGEGRPKQLYLGGR